MDIKNKDSLEIIKENYITFSKYTVEYRTYPSIYDGMKSVARRCLYASYKHTPRHKVKVTNHVGACLRYHPHGDCHRGDTIFYSLDGNHLTIKEMFDSGKKYFESLAVNTDTGNIEPCIISNVRIGQYSKKLYHIFLNDNSEIVVTGNHPIMSKNLSYIKAEDIKISDELYSGYVCHDSIYSAYSKGQASVIYKLVADKYFKDIKYDVVHHKDGNHCNNSLDNLSPISRRDHALEHRDYLLGLSKGRESMFINSSPMRDLIKDKNSKLIKIYNRDQNLRKFKMIIDYMISNNYEINELSYESLRNKKLFYNQPKISSLTKRYNVNDFNGLLNISINSVGSIYGEESSSSSTTEINSNINSRNRRGRKWRSIRSKLAQSYLLVTNVIVENLENPEPMYDFTSDTYNNAIIITSNQGEYYKYLPVHNSSITGCIIGMASRHRSPFPLYETQGNFGDRENPASAPRYLMCMLSDVSIDIFMPFLEYADYGSPEFEEEPLALPTLLPLAFLHGSSGIGVGTPNPNIPAFNPVDLINYYVEALNDNDFNVRDNFMVKPNVGNTYVSSSKKDWLSMMKSGQGKITYQPEIEHNGNTIIITKVPLGRSIDNLMKKFSTEIAQDKIDIRDESDTEVRYVIEKVSRKSVDMNNICKRALNAMTISETYKFIFSDNGKATFCGFNDVVRSNLKYTTKCCIRKFKNDYKRLSKQLLVLEIIEKMKKDKIVNKLSQYDEKEILKLLSEKYGIDNEISKAVLQRPISYLTREHLSEISNMRNDLDTISRYIDNPREYLKILYKKLIPKVKSVISNRIMTEFKKA